MRNLPFGKLDALAGAAIGGFGVQIGRAFAKPLADNEAVLLENRTTVVSVTGRPDGYRADLLPHNLKVTGSNPVRDLNPRIGAERNLARSAWRFIKITKGGLKQFAQ
jgi:hypothetical protein